MRADKYSKHPIEDLDQARRVTSTLHSLTRFMATIAKGPAVAEVQHWQKLLSNRLMVIKRKGKA